MYVLAAAVLGSFGSVTTTYAQSGGTTDKNATIGIAGGVDIITIDNAANAYIDKGALVNQNVQTLPVDQDVQVEPLEPPTLTIRLIDTNASLEELVFTGLTSRPELASQQAQVQAMRAVTISRALASTTFPARFVLVAAMNPCPCGYLGSPRHVCKCNAMQIEKYMGKISGTLLDRIDLHIEVPAVPFQELSANADGTSSAAMREQVHRARAAQRERFGPDSNRLNGRMTTRQLRKHCVLDAECKKLLQTAMDELGLSARAHDRILRVARTLADMDGASDIQTETGRSMASPPKSVKNRWSFGSP